MKKPIPSKVVIVHNPPQGTKGAQENPEPIAQQTTVNPAEQKENQKETEPAASSTPVVKED